PNAKHCLVEPAVVTAKTSGCILLTIPLTNLSNCSRSDQNATSSKIAKCGLSPSMDFSSELKGTKLPSVSFTASTPAQRCTRLASSFESVTQRRASRQTRRLCSFLVAALNTSGYFSQSHTRPHSATTLASRVLPFFLEQLIHASVKRRAPLGFFHPNMLARQNTCHGSSCKSQNAAAK